MTHYKLKFKERPHYPKWPPQTMKIGKAILNVRVIFRLKSDADEAKKFYKRAGSRVRIIKKKDGYWVYAGR